MMSLHEALPRARTEEDVKDAYIKALGLPCNSRARSAMNIGSTAQGGERNPNAGRYQIRRALKEYGEAGLADFGPFEAAYAALAAKNGGTGCSSNIGRW
jgi:hypothetical protein